MEIGRTGAPAPRRVHLGAGVANVSNATGHLVPVSFFTASPLLLRSRISLSAGSRTNSCPLASWSFNTVTRRLDNVVTWEIPNAAEDSLVLYRVKFGSSTKEKLKVLRPDAAGVVELFIHHIPRNQRPEYVTRASLAARRARPRQAARPIQATHFHAFYNMLRVQPWEHRPIPRHVLDTGEICTWSTNDDKTLVSLVRIGAGTAACMVASGTPAGP